MPEESNANSTFETIVAGGLIAAFASFFNHSCYPDIGYFNNDKGEILCHAIKPIKKGSQVKNILIY